VYVLAGNSDDQGGLFAFDATGARGCSGSPVVCQPLWTAPIVNDDAPTIAAGRVYASNAGGRLEVYDAAGVEGCSGVPVVCQPLWTAPSGEGVVPPSKPAVVDGVAYVATRSGTLVASDAAGVTNCSGAPKVCQPLWTAPGNGSFAGVPPAPVVGGGKAYVVHGQPGGAGGAEVAAYDAAGVTSCTGVPTTCAPLWRTPVQASIGSFYELALTDEYLLVPNAIGANLPPGPGNPALGQAFRVDGAGCAAASCPPAFRWGGPVTPIVVNHLILFGAPQLFAVDAHGIANCSAGICAPVAQSAGPVGGTTATGRATAGGRVFTVSLAADGTGALTAAW